MGSVQCLTRPMFVVLAMIVTYVTATYDKDPGLRFGGQFAGTCNGDGMYYNDGNSYVMCSHSIAYIMPCAPGTRNSGRQLQLQTGDDLDFTAFCDVNLVDIGYAAFHSQDNAGGSGSGSKTSQGYGAKTPKGYGSGSKSSGSYSSGGRSSGGSSAGGYGSGTQGYGRQQQGNGYGTVKVVSYQQKSYAKSPSPSTGYSQQQNRFNMQGYGAMQAKPKPGYGQVLGYRSSQQNAGGYGNQNRNTIQFQGFQTQNTARKY